MRPRVLSVNVGAIRLVEWRGVHVTTGIWKQSVAGRVALRGVNFEGDDQADRSVHGGPDKAVYAYASEDYDYWRDEEGLDTPTALFGENLTTVGLDLSAAMPGEQWRVGSALLEVTQPRLPCYKLGIRMGDPRFLRRFLAARRVGAYLRIVQAGDVGEGDEVHIVSRPDHGVSLRDMVDAVRDPAKAAALRAVRHLPKYWQEIADGV
ncbi:MAG: MOSC domain-containing protein [bacterium]